MRKDTEMALAKYETKTFGRQKAIEKAESLLSDDENVLFVTPTNLIITNIGSRKKEKLPGVAFLTNKRFLFCYKVMLNFSTETVSLDEIRAINSNGNQITGAHIEIHTISKIYDILVTYKKDIVQKIQKEFESAKDKYTSIQSTQSANPQQDILEQIEKLSSLKENGIITDSEFQAKKSDLLNRL